MLLPHGDLTFTYQYDQMQLAKSCMFYTVASDGHFICLFVSKTSPCLFCAECYRMQIVVRKSMQWSVRPVELSHRQAKLSVREN